VTFARGLALVGLVVAAVSVLPADTLAFCRMSTEPNECCNETDGSCTNLAWRRRCMSYAIDLGGSASISMAEIRTIADEAFNAWKQLECDGVRSVFEVQQLEANSDCDIAEFDQDGGNVNTIAFITDWEARDNDPRAFALTTVWHSVRSGEIFDADMEINENRGPYGICPDVTGCTDGTTVDLQNVLTHEAGHFFGLGHSTDVNASMFSMSPPGEVSRRILRADDNDGFCAIYPPGSLPDACNFDPVGGLELKCAEGCGCAATGAGDGRWIPSALAAIGVFVVLRRRRR
jgi:MYXO-CTERM domain-containing protein